MEEQVWRTGKYEGQERARAMYPKVGHKPLCDELQGTPTPFAKTSPSMLLARMTYWVPATAGPATQSIGLQKLLETTYGFVNNGLNGCPFWILLKAIPRFVEANRVGNRLAGLERKCQKSIPPSSVTTQYIG